MYARLDKYIALFQSSEQAARMAEENPMKKAQVGLYFVTQLYVLVGHGPGGRRQGHLPARCWRTRTG